ncbi:hypothetical protein KUTeg_021686, partial [Tegillarca granosa]
MLTADEKNYRRRIWTDPKHAGSFTGPGKLYQIVKKEGKYKIVFYSIKQFLADQDSYSLQKVGSSSVIDPVESEDLLQLENLSQCLKSPVTTGTQYTKIILQLEINHLTVFK